MDKAILRESMISATIHCRQFQLTERQDSHQGTSVPYNENFEDALSLNAVHLPLIFRSSFFMSQLFRWLKPTAMDKSLVPLKYILIFTLLIINSLKFLQL
jgi:hypothetical protein